MDAAKGLKDPSSVTTFWHRERHRTASLPAWDTRCFRAFCTTLCLRSHCPLENDVLSLVKGTRVH